MSIRQRNGIWQVDFCAPSGERIRCSTGTADKKAAQEYHDRLKAQLWRQYKLGEEPAHTFDEAAVRFLAASSGQSDYSSKVRYIKYWRGRLGQLNVSDITTDHVLNNLPTHKVYKHKGAMPLAQSTKNRYIAPIRTMLNMCIDWGWLSRVPKLEYFDEPKRRIRWITPAQAAALISAIAQAWLRDASAFGFATGLRENEIYSLEWQQVNMQRSTAWIESDQAKSGRARTIPLNADALAVLKRREGMHPVYVFSRNGNRITGGDDRMFKVALTKAKIKNFRFHDIRHTWASWHVQSGTPLMVVKELGGWETIEMVQKYAHLAPSHLVGHANNVTFLSQQPASAKENGNSDSPRIAVAA